VEGPLATWYDPGVDRRWITHPARRQPDKVALVSSVVLISAWTVLVTLGSPYLALLAAIILVLAVTPFLFPTRHRLGDDGVEVTRLGNRRYRRWPELRRAQIGRDGALLSPFARRSWLDRYRGVVLSFDGLAADERAQIVDELRRRVPGAAAPPATAATTATPAATPAATPEPPA
jgi:hypothetical protein